MERDKITEVLEDVGAVVLANACGPCIGQVRRSPLDKALVHKRFASGNVRTQKKVQMVSLIYPTKRLLTRRKQFLPRSTGKRFTLSKVIGLYSSLGTLSHAMMVIASR